MVMMMLVIMVMVVMFVFMLMVVIVVLMVMVVVMMVMLVIVVTVRMCMAAFFAIFFFGVFLHFQDFLFRCVEQFKAEHVAHMNRTCVKVLDFRKGIDATNFVNHFRVNRFVY